MMKQLSFNEEDKQKFLEMIDYFDGVVELLPDETEGYINRGFMFFLLQEFKRALDDFNKVVELEPDNLLIRCISGFSLDRLNQPQKAHDEFINILDIDPNFSDAYLGLALLKIKHGKAEEGISYLDRAVDLNPKNTRVYVLRGQLYHGKEDYDKAISDFEQALNTDVNIKNLIAKDLGEAYFKKGLTYSDKKEYEKAAELLSKSLSMDPVNPDGYLFRGEAYMNISKFSKARKDLKKAAALDHKGKVGKTARQLLEIVNKLA